MPLNSPGCMWQHWALRQKKGFHRGRHHPRAKHSTPNWKLRQVLPESLLVSHSDCHTLAPPAWMGESKYWLSDDNILQVGTFTDCLFGLFSRFIYVVDLWMSTGLLQLVPTQTYFSLSLYYHITAQYPWNLSYCSTVMIITKFSSQNLNILQSKMTLLV